jgi:hypothetical protein
MPDYDELYHQHEHRIEDFWDRRANTPKYDRTIHVFGQPVTFYSNYETVLDCANIAERLYSIAAPNGKPAWQIHLTVHDSGTSTSSGQRPRPAPLPARLIDVIDYAGADDWLSIDLRGWGNCFVNMGRYEAHAVLSPALVMNPEQISQVLINTILTNLITHRGYSMLHASALVKDGDILLLQAPHGTGKSTTALRLILNGYKLLSDSMVYIGEQDHDLWLGGFPVGRIKLRSDMLPLFPALAAQAEEEAIRNETKHRVDLKRISSEMTYNEMIRIRRVEFCLLQRWGKSESKIEPVTREEIWPEIMVNSLHYNTLEVWRENLRKIDRLLERANLHRLSIGTSENEILNSINRLWTQ